MQFVLFLVICFLIAKAMGGIVLMPFIIIGFCVGWSIWGHIVAGVRR